MRQDPHALAGRAGAAGAGFGKVEDVWRPNAVSLGGLGASAGTQGVGGCFALRDAAQGDVELAFRVVVAVQDGARAAPAATGLIERCCLARIDHHLKTELATPFVLGGHPSRFRRRMRQRNACRERQGHTHANKQTRFHEPP